MFVYHDSTGKIIGACEAADANVTPPNNLGTPLYLDDATYADVWNNQSEYTIQNNMPVFTPIPDATKLANAQSAKISELRNGYNQTIAGGFSITLGATTHTFGWSTDDKTNLLATQEGITDGDLTFPVHYADIHGSPVSIPDQSTLSSIKSKATSFFNSQHQQILSLIGQDESATTVDAVNVIQWSAAAY